MSRDAPLPSAPEHSVTAPREPWLAVTWGAAFPGLGHAYAGDFRGAWAWGAGLVVLTLAAGAFMFLPRWPVLPSYVLLALALALAVVSLVHAHAIARRTLTAEADAERRSGREAWKAVFLSLLLPGVGQLYDRRWAAGAVFLVLALAVSTLPESLQRFAGEILAAIAMFEAWNGARARRGGDERDLRRVVAVHVVMLTVAVLATMGVRATLVRAARVPSVSMQPTLMAGDYILLDVTRRGHADRDDLAAFERPGDSKNEYVKRVLGVAADDVEFGADGVWRNGVRIMDGPSFAGEPPAGALGASGTPYRVPSGRVFMVGDWLVNSNDSRTFGPVPMASIRGRAYKIYWPPNRTRTLTPAPAREGTLARTPDHP